MNSLNIVSGRWLSSVGPNLVYRKMKVTGKDQQTLQSRAIPVPGFKGEALYGTASVMEALIAKKRTIHKLYLKKSVKKRECSRVEKILKLTEEQSIAVAHLTQAQFDRKTDFQVHNGICLDASAIEYDDFKPRMDSVCMTGVLDPGNIGAIARSSLFFGFRQMIFIDDYPSPSEITPAMSKASCGAIEHMNIVKSRDTDELPDVIRIGTMDPSAAQGLKIVNFNDLVVPPNKTIHLYLGGEQSGLPRECIDKCHILTTIPSFNSSSSDDVTSLNVSVAAGIILYKLSIR